MIAEIYGPLYEDVSRILREHPEGSAPRRFLYTDYSTPMLGVKCFLWTKIRLTYQSLKVDKTLANKLDKLSNEFKEFDNKLSKIQDFADNLAEEEATKFFSSYGLVKAVVFNYGRSTDGESFTYSYTSIDETLVEGERPDITINKLKKDKEVQKFDIALYPEESEKIELEYANSAKQLFDEYWESCHKKMESNPDVISVRKQYPELIKETSNMREELAKRIQEQ